MLNVKVFICNMFQENCYVVSDEDNNCIIIDCGALYQDEQDKIIDYIRQNNLRPAHLLCTHGHLDHVFGNITIYEEFGLKPSVSSKDSRLLENISGQVKGFLNVDYNMPTVPTGRFIDNGEDITMGAHTFKVMETPGHSKGSVIFYNKEDNIAFSGDTLFRMSIGRTDLEGGDYKEIQSSIKKMMEELPENMKVYPGHGPATTLREERLMNPYIGI